MDINEHKAHSALDNIEMSDKQREAIKENKKSFINQSRLMFKLFNKLCKKCRTNVVKGVQSGLLNKVTGDQFRELFCDKCKERYDKVTK